MRIVDNIAIRDLKEIQFEKKSERWMRGIE